MSRADDDGLTLQVMAGRLAICRLGPTDAVPAWAQGGRLSVVVRTVNELSIACDEAGVPGTTRAERGWRALVVEGPLAFTLIGVLARLAAPLAEAAIPILAVSTFDTDYLLVREESLERAIAALLAAGHRIVRATERT